MTRLILFYGPPAAGKLTVAKKVSEALSAFLIHNHMTYDEITKGTDIRFGSEILQQKNAQMRLAILKSLFERGDENVLLTFCYEPNFDQEFVGNLQHLCEQYSVPVYPVLLYSDRETLLNRVSNMDRASFNKVKNTKDLEESLDKYNFTADFPIGVKLIKINTSQVTPEISCRKILDSLLTSKQLVEEDEKIDTSQVTSGFLDIDNQTIKSMPVAKNCNIIKYVTLGAVILAGIYFIYSKFFSNIDNFEESSHSLIGDTEFISDEL